MSSFNLNPLNQAFNLLNFLNILDSTIPSYFYFFKCLSNYLDTYYPKTPKIYQKYPKILKPSFPLECDWGSLEMRATGPTGAKMVRKGF